MECSIIELVSQQKMVRSTSKDFILEVKIYINRVLQRMNTTVSVSIVNHCIDIIHLRTCVYKCKILIKLLSTILCVNAMVLPAKNETSQCRKSYTYICNSSPHEYLKGHVFV